LALFHSSHHGHCHSFRCAQHVRGSRNCSAHWVPPRGVDNGARCWCWMRLCCSCRAGHCGFWYPKAVLDQTSFTVSLKVFDFHIDHAISFSYIHPGFILQYLARCGGCIRCCPFSLRLWVLLQMPLLRGVAHRGLCHIIFACEAPLHNSSSLPYWLFPVSETCFYYDIFCTFTV